MKRILQFKIKQWTYLFKIVLCLSLGILALVFAASRFLAGGTQSDIGIIFPSNPLIIVGIFLLLLIEIFLMLAPLSEGSGDFDAAMRFGFNRKHYLLTNLLSYSVLVLISLFLSPLKVIGTETQFSSFADFLKMGFQAIKVTKFVDQILIILLLVLFSYMMYRFGSKVVLTGVLIVYFLFSGVFVLAVSNPPLIFPILDLLEWIESIDYLPIILKAGLLSAMFFIYYRVVHRLEVK